MSLLHELSSTPIQKYAQVTNPISWPMVTTDNYVHNPRPKRNAKPVQPFPRA